MAKMTIYKTSYLRQNVWKEEMTLAALMIWDLLLYLFIDQRHRPSEGQADRWTPTSNGSHQEHLHSGRRHGSHKCKIFFISIFSCFRKFPIMDSTIILCTITLLQPCYGMNEDCRRWSLIYVICVWETLISFFLN